MSKIHRALAPSFTKLLAGIFLISFCISFSAFSQPGCTPPTATISLFSPAVCQGSPALLRLASATGQGPYNLVVNGVTYSNINVGQTFGPSNASETSVWSANTIPANPDFVDGEALEIGTKIRSSVDGYITGIRFYKGPSNTGVHTASLWNNAGTLLARADFSAESASGWQEVRFATPVAILANTTYTASYYSPNGFYAISTNYFATQSATTGPLTALQSNTIDGSNGVFRYGGGFPTQSYSSSNYWVDVLFTETIAATTASFLLTSITDANGCSNNGNLSSATLTINPLPGGTLSASQVLCTGQQINLNFNATSGTGPYSIVTNSITNNNVINNQPFATTINAANPSPAGISIWSSGPVTGIVPVVTDNDPVELGVKFKAAITGSITGLRFYKRAENTGVHTGSLWTNTGTLLATATFSNESATGWQTVTFPYPIAITANQIFIASYFSPNGQYAFSQNYFNGYSPVNGPLTAVQTNNTDGPNGIYTYGGGFPTQGFNNNNYWVDVIFTGSQGNNLINMTQITDANGCTTSASPIQAINIPTAQCIPLPVTLVNFSLEVQTKKIILQWETASENNNSGFEIQRSTNGTSWTVVGFVKGAGNSSLANQYSFTDVDLSNGHYYYRLNQIDFDSKHKFSNVLSGEIKGGPQYYLGQNYPNPASGNTTINYSIQQPSPVNISLYDVYGRLVKTFVNENKTTGQYTLTADLQALSPGTYYYRMNAGVFHETKKIVIGYR